MEAVSKFDTNVTIRYKQAAAFRPPIPIRYTYVGDNGVLRSIIDLVTTRIREGVNIIRIYEEIINLDNPNPLGPVESAMLYTYMGSLLGYKIDDMLPIVNAFYDYINSESSADDSEIKLRLLVKFRDVNEFRNELAAWSEKYMLLLARDKEILDSVNAIQKDLGSIEPVKYSDLDISKRTLKFSPKWKNGKDIDPADGIEIFDKAVPSYNVPFIQYNDNNAKHFQRIYNGTEEDNDIPPLHMIMQPPTTKPNIIYLTIWTGAPGSTPTSQSYVRCLYSIADNQIKIPVRLSTITVEAMVDRVAKALPTIALGEGKESRIGGSFNVENVSINEAVLHFLIINSPLFSTYIYIDESTKSRADKKRLQIHYKTFTGGLDIDEASGIEQISNAASVSVSFGPADIGDSEDSIQPPEGFVPPEQEALPESRLLRVNVVRAESQPVLQQFLEVFTRLLSYYMQNKNDIEAELANILGVVVRTPSQRSVSSSSSTGTSATGTGTSSATGREEGEDEEEGEEAKGKQGGVDKKIKNLRAQAPDVFVTRFARKCQCKLQPIIIKQDEIEAWVKYTFTDESGQIQNRQVMPFPPPASPSDVPKWYFVCPDNKNPYPQLKENRDLDNSKEYPFVPCCAKTESITGSNSNYANFYEVKNNPELLAKTKETTKQGYRMTTDKIIQHGRTGTIPKLLIDLLRSRAPSVEGTADEDFIRVGVQPSPSSLIHCVALALQDPHYINRNTPELREEYVNIRRKQIAGTLESSNTVYPLVYKQELYELSAEEIAQRVDKKELFLDPYMYYRGVEEFFNVNLFVFNLKGPLHPIPGIQDASITGPVMEIPRCKLLHIRTHRAEKREQRRTVIILKHWGAESDALLHPQCELIISRGRIIPSEGLSKLVAASGGGAVVSGATSMASGGSLISIPTGSGASYGAAPEISSKAMYSFGEDMFIMLMNVLTDTFHAYVWNFPRKPLRDNSKQPASLIQARDNPYYKIDWQDVFKYKIVSQRVDAYGKLRIIGVETLTDEKKTLIVTIYVPPSQPLNLPYMKEITVAPEIVVRRLLGVPTGVTKVGLWYSAIDYDWAVFVPATMISPPDPESPPPITMPVEYKASGGDSEAKVDLRDPLKEVRIVKRLTSILMQLINWSWRSNRLPPADLTTPENLDNWWSKWVVRDESKDMKVDGRMVLPIKYSRRLPDASSTLTALNGISGWWPPYFVGGNEPPEPKLSQKEELPVLRQLASIVQPLPTPAPVPVIAAAPASRAMLGPAPIIPAQAGYAGIHLYPALYDRAKAYFMRYATVTDGLPPNDDMVRPPSHLADLYVYESDFVHVPKSLVFVDLKHSDAWRLDRELKGSLNNLINPILQKVDISVANIFTPILYKDIETGKIYIIQNVQGGDLHRAVNLTLIWRDRGINTGRLTEPRNVDLTREPYVAYGISKANTLVPYESNIEASPTKYIQLLKYNNTNKYAAMLPIL